MRYRYEMEKKKSKKKIIIISVIAVLSLIVLLLAGWWGLCVYMYEDNINVRCETYEPLMLRVEDFEGVRWQKWKATISP